MELGRFVLVEHPDRGRIVFLCTDLGLNPIQIIRLYGLRFKIEFSFKQAVELTRYAGAGFAGKFTRRIPAERRILLS